MPRTSQLAAKADQTPVPAGLAGTPHGAMSYPARKYSLLAAWMARSAQCGWDGARLFGMGIDQKLWSDLFDMQQAVWQQLTLLERKGEDGLAAWGQEVAEIKSANTLSKLCEQEFNLIAQLGALISRQTSDFVALMESLQVGYAYWLKDRLED